MRWNSFAFATVAALALVWDAGAQTPSSYHVTSKIPLSDGGWDYAAVDDAGRFYLPRPDRITAIDLAAKSVTDKFAPVSVTLLIVCPCTPLAGLIELSVGAGVVS